MRSGLLGLALLVPAAGRADDPRAAERQAQRAIDAAAPAVVAVVVSHSPHYEPAVPAADRERGKLGGYDPPHAARGPWAGPPARDRLDLSDPENVPDHQFGSGVVLSDAGLVLTNHHLIDGATKVYVRGVTADRRGWGSYADIRAADARSDLAVLQLLTPPAGLTPARVGTVRLAPGPAGEPPTVRRGTRVVALGHPLAAGAADGEPTAAEGIVGGVRRRVAGPPREERARTLAQYGGLIQTDARLALGCSGAALVNLDGDLVGLAAPLAAVTGAETAGGFAVPLDPNHRRIVAALQAGREVEYGFLGVSPGAVLADGGMTIGTVSPGSPAADAKLRPGDVILAVDGNPVREQDDLFLYVGAALAGTRVRLTVADPAGPRAVPVTLAKFDNPLPWVASVRPAPVHGLRVDYTSVLMNRNAGGFRGQQPRPVPPGALVREVVPGSPAAAQLKAPGWVVTHVDGRPVATPAEFYQAAGAGGPVRLRVVDPNDPAAEKEVRLP